MSTNLSAGVVGRIVEPAFNTEDCLTGGGEIGELMRSLDWSKSPLGPVNTWPQSLRTAVSICLGSRYPMEILWGPDYIRIYNDAYRPILGANKHPQFLGRSHRECWAEIWDQIGPMLDGVMRTGEATWSEDHQLIVERNGYAEEAYFTFSYSPLRVEGEAIGGIFCACTETTSRVLSGRRLTALRELATGTAEARDVDDACRLSMAALAGAAMDVPFALLYLFDAARSEAVLAASVGVESGSSVAPRTLPLAGTSGSAWPIGAVAAGGASVLVDDVRARVGEIAGGAWPEPVERAMVLPVVLRGRQQVIGAVVIGASPRAPLDAEYRRFLEAVAMQISTAVTDAQTLEEERRRAGVDAERDRQERARLTSILMQAPAFIAVTNGPDHVFEFSNQPYYQLIGHRDILGKTVKEALPEVVDQGFVGLLDQVYRTGQPFVGSNVAVRVHTGPTAVLEERYLDFTYQPLFSSDGTVNGILVHGVDLTGRRNAEREKERLLELEQSAREELERQRDRLEKANQEILAASRILEAQQEHQAVVVRYLRGTNRVAAILTGADSVDTIVGTLLGTLTNDFRAAICGVWLAGSNGRRLVLAGDRGLAAAPTPSLEPEIEVLLHPYKIGWVARYRRPFVSNDVADDVHFDRSWLAANRIVSAAVQPLIVQEKLLGVMAAFFSHDLPIEASEVLSTLASVVSTSLAGAIGEEESGDE